jgi:hypothetical protein
MRQSTQHEKLLQACSPLQYPGWSRHFASSFSRTYRDLPTILLDAPGKAANETVRNFSQAEFSLTSVSHSNCLTWPVAPNSVQAAPGTKGMQVSQHKRLVHMSTHKAFFMNNNAHMSLWLCSTGAYDQTIFSTSSSVLGFPLILKKFRRYL